MAFWNKSASEPKAEAPLACSFCGKTQQQVQQLIAGPACYICDGCVRLSMDLVEPAVEVPAPQPSEAALRTAMATRVCGLRPQISLLARITAANAQGDGRPPTVLLVGAPGVGKTALCEALVEGCGLPAAHAHVHRITATGYIGADLENIVQQVVLAAGDHRHHADRGLLVLEDLHHLGLRSPVATLARDVGGRDVQPHLVRLLDRRVLYLPDDPAQRLHPMQSAAQYDPAGLLVLLTCRLDALPDDPSQAALRAALIDIGLTQELLDRVDLVVPMALPAAEVLEEVVTEHLLPEVSRTMGPQAPMEHGELASLVAAAQVPGAGGAWRLRQGVVQRALGAASGLLDTLPQSSTKA